MSILKRIRSILASNIQTKIENAKNPEVEVNQYIREMERDLREVKGQSDATITLMNRAKRNVYEYQEEMFKMERYAVKALEAGDENKARRFLEDKVSLKTKADECKKQYELAAIKMEQMKLAEEKLSQDLAELSNQRDFMVSKLSIAKSKQQLNEIGTSQSNVRLTAFDQLEEKANRALAEAEALEELRNGLDGDIRKQVSLLDNSVDMQFELTDLKKKMK